MRGFKTRRANRDCTRAQVQDAHANHDCTSAVVQDGRANGVHFSRRFTLRLEAMLEFVASVIDAGGHVPMVGDADDAVMVRFSRQAGF